MPKFRKKPVEVEAVQWTGDNHGDVVAFATRPSKSYPGAFIELFIEVNTEAAIDLIGKSRLGDMIRKGCTAAIYVDANSEWLGIETGEWIIQDAKGFYPCKPDIFAATYDAVPTRVQVTTFPGGGGGGGAGGSVFSNPAFGRY